MKIRLSWFLVIMIYLSVNGQVFAKAAHICTEMALISTVLSSSRTIVNIHEHHKTVEHSENNKQINNVHKTHKSTTMDNCHCVDCDCVQNITGQANASLLQETRLSNFFPVISIIVAKLNKDLISLPYSNPYRPPVTA